MEVLTSSHQDGEDLCQGEGKVGLVRKLTRGGPPKLFLMKNKSRALKTEKGAQVLDRPGALECPARIEAQVTQKADPQQGDGVLAGRDSSETVEVLHHHTNRAIEEPVHEGPRGKARPIAESNQDPVHCSSLFPTKGEPLNGQPEAGMKEAESLTHAEKQTLMGEGRGPRCLKWVRGSRGVWAALICVRKSQKKPRAAQSEEWSVCKAPHMGGSVELRNGAEAHEDVSHTQGKCDQGMREGKGRRPGKLKRKGTGRKWASFRHMLASRQGTELISGSQSPGENSAANRTDPLGKLLRGTKRRAWSPRTRGVCARANDSASNTTCPRSPSLSQERVLDLAPAGTSEQHPTGTHCENSQGGESVGEAPPATAHGQTERGQTNAGFQPREKPAQEAVTSPGPAGTDTRQPMGLCQATTRGNSSAPAQDSGQSLAQGSQSSYPAESRSQENGEDPCAQCSSPARGTEGRAGISASCQAAGLQEARGGLQGTAPTGRNQPGSHSAPCHQLNRGGDQGLGNEQGLRAENGGLWGGCLQPPGAGAWETLISQTAQRIVESAIQGAVRQLMEDMELNGCPPDLPPASAATRSRELGETRLADTGGEITRLATCGHPGSLCPAGSALGTQEEEGPVCPGLALGTELPYICDGHLPVPAAHIVHTCTKLLFFKGIFFLIPFVTPPHSQAVAQPQGVCLQNC
ncbi:uncharacterized protein LOC103189751 [Callorhinchus milii]|uniref:uncharacterized protein LOC103189751 n=1 Tax=Callorhinchus milii TaxID=7868 RepID=UPI001C3F9A59|nr:uncharacterized protein LOC103189751 [Callorhinchus milii]